MSSRVAREEDLQNEKRSIEQELEDVRKALEEARRQAMEERGRIKSQNKEEHPHNGNETAYDEMRAARDRSELMAAREAHLTDQIQALLQELNTVERRIKKLALECSLGEDHTVLRMIEPTTSTVSFTKGLLNVSVKFGKLKEMEVSTLIFGNCASTLFCKSLEFLPDLKILMLKDVSAQQHFLPKLSESLKERRKTSGRLMLLFSVADAKPRASNKGIFSLSQVFKSGSITMAGLQLGAPLSSFEVKLVRQGVSGHKDVDETVQVTVTEGNISQYTFSSNTSLADSMRVTSY